MAIVNSSPIPQFAIDQDHRILYWNRALEAISRIKAGMLLARSNNGRHSTTKEGLPWQIY